MRAPIEEMLLGRIAREGPLPFSEFMEAALYHPEHGYYAQGPAIGAEGDFYTSASLPPFAWALARQARDAWERLGRPDPFRIVELGGGTGALATRLRDEIARDDELAKAARLVLVERAAGLAAAQRARGFDVVARLDDLPPAPTLLVANEVLDALPVRLFLPGRRERRVGESRGRLAFVDVPAGDAPDVASGLREVAVGLDALLAGVARVVAPGYALLVDYGERGPSPRPDGTLRAFAEHRVEADLLAEPGRRDLTADVDFAAVEAAAARAGLAPLGFTTQGRFLVALGLLEHAAREQGRGDPQPMLQAKTLVLPGGMGERFKVLALGRDAAGPLAGFRPVW